MTDRSGVEIDYCPQCRGVWLDRGELDKIIERASGPAHVRSEHRDDDYERSYRRDDDDDNYRERRDHGHDDRSHGDHHKKHKKESFLGDLFDF